MMKATVKTVKKTVVLSVLVLLFSCNQDPIFFKISTETVPKEPRIQGGPTGMVYFTRNGVPAMYVASGSLHWYSYSAWDTGAGSVPQPGGKVIGLAATSEHLYALCISGTGTDTRLRRIGSDGGWEDIGIAEGGYGSIQTIYADNSSNRLFAGARNGSDVYGILFSDGNVLKLLQDNTGMLSGAAFLSGSYYLSTRRGLYTVAEADLPDLSANPGAARQLGYIGSPGQEYRTFMGLIKINDKVIAVERNEGVFYQAGDEGFFPIGISTGKYATGALALWRNVNNEDEKILVAGIQGGLYNTSTSSYTHGYVEFGFKPGSYDLNGSRNDPPTVTVDGLTDRYTATIGKHPINHLYQAPREIDGNMTFFASTQSAGLWSYRDREGGLQWNAEE